MGTGQGHGTGRHGAQTGLDRQALRAATQGVTPDKQGNKHGVTQHTAKWNKVTIEYEEKENGEKVIKNRSSVEKSIIAAADTIVKSDIGSKRRLFEERSTRGDGDLHAATLHNEVALRKSNFKRHRQSLWQTRVAVQWRALPCRLFSHGLVFESQPQPAVSGEYPLTQNITHSSKELTILWLHA